MGVYVKKKISLALTAFLAFVLLTNCQSLMAAFQDPVVSLHSVELTNININGARLLCKVQVENRNSFEIPFPETDWEFFINSNSFISGTVKNNQRIKGRSTTIIDVPVSLDYLEVINTFRSLVGSQQIGYKVALGVNFLLPVLGDKTWQFEHEGVVPMPQLPRLSAPSMSIGSRDLTGAEIIVSMNLINPNVFDLPSPKIAYDFMINRNSFIKGAIENEGTLAASSTTPVSFRLLVNYADLLRSFVSLVTAREASTLINLECDFGIPIFNGPVIKQQIQGTLPLR